MKRAAPAPPPTTSVKRLKPAPAITSVVVQNTEWHGGSEERVTWESAGAVPEVHISLVQTGGSTIPRTIAYGVTNTGGSYLVTVPVGLVPGDYILKVKSSVARETVSGHTTIRIDPDAVPPAITSVAVQDTEWSGGSKQRITWESAGAVPSTLR